MTRRPNVTLILRAILAVLAAHHVTAASADEAITRKGFSMLAKWQCMAWAEMMQDRKIAEGFFRAGLADGRDLTGAYLAGNFSNEDLGKVPVMVGQTMSVFSADALSEFGLTQDFLLGRLFEMIASDAHADVVTRNEQGQTLDPVDYRIAEEVQKFYAGEKFRNRNCSILLDG